MKAIHCCNWSMWTVDWSHYRMDIWLRWKSQDWHMLRWTMIHTSKIWWQFCELAMNLLMRPIAKLRSIFFLIRSRSGTRSGNYFFRIAYNIVADALSRRPQISTFESSAMMINVLWMLGFFGISWRLKGDDRIACPTLCKVIAPPRLFS